MKNFNTLKNITSHFYMVSIDNLDDSGGGDSLFPTIEDCDNYIKYATEETIKHNENYYVTITEYVVNNINEFSDFTSEAFFDNMDLFNGDIIDSFIIGNKKLINI